MNTNETLLIQKVEYFLERANSVQEDFGGPSVYFHIEAVKAAHQNPLGDRHIEMIYATLASWGMHRMGDSARMKSKLVSFKNFSESILDQEKSILRLRDSKFESIDSVLQELGAIYNNLRVSESSATIVANSKTLAHLLPDLVPPIDRNFTIRFLTQEPTAFYGSNGKLSTIILPKDKAAQLSEFKNYCIRLKGLYGAIEKVANLKVTEESFNSSIPKIIDNLIVAYVKDCITQQRHKRS